MENSDNNRLDCKGTKTSTTIVIATTKYNNNATTIHKQQFCQRQYSEKSSQFQLHQQSTLDSFLKYLAVAELFHHLRSIISFFVSCLRDSELGGLPLLLCCQNASKVLGALTPRTWLFLGF